MDYRKIIEKQAKEIKSLKKVIDKYSNYDEKGEDRKADTQRKIIQGSIFKKVFIDEMHYDFLLGFIILSLNKIKNIEEVIEMYLTGENMRKTKTEISKKEITIDISQMLSSDFFESNHHAKLAIEDLFGVNIKNNKITIKTNEFLENLF